MGLLFVALITGADGRWHAANGDPTAMGWVTVFAYFSAAYLAYKAMQASRFGARTLRPVAPAEADNQRLLAKVWVVATLVMVLLGINKQFDLQSLLTQTMRDLAHDHGWYGERRPFQVKVIIAVIAAALAGLVAIVYPLRRVLGRVLWVLAAIAWIIAFVSIRATSLHQVDFLLSRGGPLRLNWVCELGGIAVLAASAYRTARVALGAQS
jgi:hypothetical protein